MSLAPGKPAAPTGATTEIDLRAKIKTLIHERDAARDSAERANDEAKELRAVLRHVLTVSCDGCKNRLTLSLGAPATEGTHASGLYSAGMAMGWKFGAATLGALFQMMQRPTPAAFGALDHCPACMTKGAG